jgi:dTDP-4-amino-4,6-dideoxygalactose transaminase
MKLGRTVPPAAAPLLAEDLAHALAGAVAGRRARAALEDDVRRYFGVRHVFLLSSGTAALRLALTALASIRNRADVVLPAYTCFSVPAAVVAAGLRPVACDIDPSNFDFDHQQLARSVTANTLCVVSHHLFGIPSDVDRVSALCRDRGAFVVEDAAQAMGGEWQGRRLGTLGEVGIFSLGRGKHITCGAGGIIVTNSDEIARALSSRYRELPEPSSLEVAREFLMLLTMAVFIRPSLYWIPAALPFLRLGETIFPTRVPMARLSGLRAGTLRRWRNRLSHSGSSRAATAAYFAERLRVRLAAGPTYPYLRVPVLAPTPQTRRRIHDLARRRGLGLSTAYPAPVSDIPELRHLMNGRTFPAARQVSERLLTLPTHHLLSRRDKAAIAELWRTAGCA